VLGNQNADWRSARKATALAAIVDMAWELAREHGLAGLSLRDLARRLGMATPSLYSYVDSKHALYDAMFADGWQAFIDFEPQPADPTLDLATVLKVGAHRWVRFSLADPVRHQLLNHRTIPGFEPSPDSYAVAQAAYLQLRAPIEAVADFTQADMDLLTGTVDGLITQQLANEPGGKRWVGQIDDLMDLLVHHYEHRRATPSRATPRKGKKR
jgi:AcrR family transcriptional regulator